MSEHNITMQAGSAIRMKTAGKYCEGDIVVRSNGVVTTDANAIADDIKYGKTAYVDDEKITGTMPVNGAISKTLDTSTTSYSVPKGYTDGGTVNIVTEAKTVTPTKSTQSVTPSSGKVLSEVTVNPIPDTYIEVDASTPMLANAKKWDITVTTGLPSSGALLTLLTDDWLKANRSNPTLCVVILPKFTITGDGTKTQGVWLHTNMSLMYAGGQNYVSLSAYHNNTKIVTKTRYQKLTSSNNDVGDIKITTSGQLQVIAYNDYDIAVGEYAVIAFIV